MCTNIEQQCQYLDMPLPATVIQKMRNLFSKKLKNFWEILETFFYIDLFKETYY